MKETPEQAHARVAQAIADEYERSDIAAARREGAREVLAEVLDYLTKMHELARSYGGAALDAKWVYGQEIAFRNAIKDVNEIGVRYAEPEEKEET